MPLAAKRGATVTGLDASEPLLEIAAERNPDADLRQGDLEELPFGDNQFDAVTSFNAVQYAADQEAAVRELHRVAKPGGRVALVAWGRPEQCESPVILAALGKLIPPPPPGAPHGGPFALAEPGRLEAVAQVGGLTVEKAGDAPLAFEFPDLATAVAAQLTSGPARVAIAHSGKGAVRDALIEAYAGSRQPDGTCRQANVFRYVVAHK